jgi:hypothetical protein
MKKHVNEARRRLLTSILALSASLAVGVPPAASAEPQQTGCEETRGPLSTTAAKEADEKTAGISGGAGAMRVEIDPQTGEIVEPSAGVPAAEVPGSLEDAFRTSSEGLEETSSPVPGGGEMIDLRGRFRSPLAATQDAEGKLSIQHPPNVSGAGEKN